VKTILKDAASSLGVTVRRHPPAGDILSLLKKLRPIDGGKPLIRVGASGDGGYLIPDDLEGIEFCFSPGVNTIAEFESDLAKRGIKSFLADFSVDGPPVERPEFIFDKRFLGSDDNDMFFTLDTWKKKYLPSYEGDLLLQMDIEGSEYEVIFNVPVHILKKFRIIIVEFHGLDRMFDDFALPLLCRCFDKLLNYFHVVHLHPNNCCGTVKANGIEIPRTMEITFYNRNRVGNISFRQDFPHSLDKDNTSVHRTLPLPECWYRDTSA
jgi:hypothetical protein